MSAEENRKVVHRLTEEAWNKGKVEAVDHVLADNFTHHEPANPGVVSRDDYKQWLTEIRTAFPDFHLTIEDEAADGDKLAVRWTWRGTHQGNIAAPQGPIPPTGKQVQVTGLTMFRLEGGKVVEEWLHADVLGFLQQLGAIPTPGQ